MNKGTHFIGQPMYGQLLSLLDKGRILKITRETGGERYIKHFDAWQHLVIMLYAVIKRFDSLREITNSMFPEARKFLHLGISMMPRRSTHSRMPMPVGLKASSRAFTGTCMPHTGMNFRRTGGKSWFPNGCPDYRS